MEKFVLLTLTLLAVTTVVLGSSFERESYFENGQLSAKMSYKFGEKDGLHEMYYPDGALYLSANYSNGELDGIKLMFSPSGQTIRTESWVDGRLDSSSRPKKKIVNVDISRDYSPYDAYKAQWCGNGRLEMKDKARHGVNWNTLDTLTQSQIIKLEEISSNIWKLRVDSGVLNNDTKTKSTIRQDQKLSGFGGFVADAINARLFKSSSELPKFTISQLGEINNLLLDTPINLDDIKEIGLVL